MKLIHTNDGEHYRRWVNLLPTMFLPGSAQFLSGRRTAGIAWFVSYLFLSVVLIGYWVHPKTNISILAMGPSEWVLYSWWLAIVIDGFRRPICCLHLTGWALFFCLWLCLVILPGLGIRQFLVQPFKVPTSAMQPTIMGIRKDSNGNKNICDHVFVNKLIYRVSAPQRGDVIVFRTKEIASPQVKNAEFYVKRLVGLPGETISIDPPYLIVNKNKVTQPGIFRKIAEGRDGYSGYCLAATSAFLASPESKITLGPDEYLVLGDNSTNSLDGRYFGPITRSAIAGKAFYIYAPADRKRRIE